MLGVGIWNLTSDRMEEPFAELERWRAWPRDIVGSCSVRAKEQCGFHTWSTASRGVVWPPHGLQGWKLAVRQALHSTVSEIV